MSAINPQKFDDKLDLSHLITQSKWTKQELQSVVKTHRSPADFIDRAAFYSVRALRFNFDLFSMYKAKSIIGALREQDWIRRIIFLETVAGVPGMVAGMVRHLHSLRLMRRDHGWIHSLLSEAENERMHLLIALSLRQPGPIFRAAVIGGQFFFLSFYTLAYLVCPRYCHRFVGYLEEEAVHTYSKLIEDIDAGRLPMFQAAKAPRMARVYYNLPSDAMLRDVFECIRADESAHRDSNHHFSDLKEDEPNTKVEHLRKAHFQNQNVFSGVADVTTRVKQDALLGGLRRFDVDGSGFIHEDEVCKALEGTGTELEEPELRDILGKLEKDSKGRIRYEHFVKLLHA